MRGNGNCSVFKAKPYRMPSITRMRSKLPVRWVVHGRSGYGLVPWKAYGVGGHTIPQRRWSWSLPIVLRRVPPPRSYRRMPGRVRIGNKYNNKSPPPPCRPPLPPPPYPPPGTRRTFRRFRRISKVRGTIIRIPPRTRVGPMVW